MSQCTHKNIVESVICIEKILATSLVIQSVLVNCVDLNHQSILKEISPEYSLKGLMLKLKIQYAGHLMHRTNSLEKTLMLGKIEGRRRRR